MDVQFGESFLVGWCLGEMLQNVRLSHDELLTPVMYVEITLNGRPLSRGKWKQGKVEEGKANVPQRTTEEIAPLEVRETVQTRQTVTEPVGEEQVKTPKAPRRAAAMDTDFRR